jgi:hypothetical protein
MKVLFTINHHNGEKPWYQVYQGNVLKMSGNRLLDVPEGLQRLVYNKMTKTEKSLIDEVDSVPSIVPTISDIDIIGEFRITTVDVYTNVTGNKEWFDVDINGDSFGMGNCLLDVFDTVEAAVFSGTDIPYYPKSQQHSLWDSLHCSPDGVGTI